MRDEKIYNLDPPLPLNDLAKIWVPLYRRSRYLRPLTDLELDERLEDLLSNTMALHDDGKYRPRFNIRSDDVYAPIRNLDFLRMLVEAEEERRIRGGPDRPMPKTRLQLAKRLADESWCIRPDWVANSKLSVDDYERPKMLFRLAKAARNEEFLREGRVRFSPASGYKDTTAPAAVGDDELEMAWYDEKLIAHVDDYYCLCLSSEYDYRLFTDFHADSCVAIRHPDEFIQRLGKAVEEYNKRGPDNPIAVLRGAPIFYIDPFNVAAPTTAMEVQFTKHFRFAYQTEYRYVLSPSKNIPLEPIFLTLGPIADIADIVKAP
jgi:hypothetical protein